MRVLGYCPGTEPTSLCSEEKVTGSRLFLGDHFTVKVCTKYSPGSFEQLTTPPTLHHDLKQPSDLAHPPTLRTDVHFFSSVFRKALDVLVLLCAFDQFDFYSQSTNVFRSQISEFYIPRHWLSDTKATPFNIRFTKSISTTLNTPSATRQHNTQAH